MADCGYGENQLVYTYHEEPKGEPSRLVMHEHFKPLEYQVPIVDFILEPEKPIRVVTMQTGKGKAGSVNAKVKVPGGWKRMGDIKVGDKVTAWDGTATDVLGVYPQGVVQTYEVVFADGRKTVVCGEHLWKVYYINTTPKQRWRIVNTLEMARLVNMPNPRVYVPLCKSEECPEVELKIHPYLMGVLLGDGYFGRAVTLTNPDVEIIERIGSLLPPSTEIIKNDQPERCDTYRFRGVGGENGLLTRLRDYGLDGKCSWEKVIPDVYLKGSTGQRLALLNGLMDTDGTVNTRSSGGAISCSTTSPKMADQVVYLVRSLGGIAKISVRETTYTYKGERLKGRKSFDINIRYDRPEELFTLQRKKERTDNQSQYSERLKLRVVSVKPHAMEEAQCISVAHPDHLYITDDFIVTHNTKTSLFAAVKIGEKFAVVVPAMYADMWYTELEGFFKHKRGDILLVKGLKALKAALLTKASGENQASAYVITSTTIMLLIKEYETNPRLAAETVCRPEDLYALLGVGYRIIDEVHKNTALNFKIDCYTNLKKAVYLSATLDNNDAFIRRIRQIAYPANDRYDGLEYDRYINVYGLAYHAEEPRKIRYKGYQGSYSHVVFEQWLMKNKRSLEKYLRFLDEIVRRKYIQVREPGQRCLVFAATVDFCTLYMKRLRQTYPHLKIGRYTQEDNYDDMLTNDITVSTVISAGTGVDISGLRIAIMSNSMDSPSANEQVKGRLRRLKDWPDINPEFYYIFCNDIPKHVDYHRRKMEYFKGKCLNHYVFNSGFSI